MMGRPLPLVPVAKATAGTVIIAVLMVFLMPLFPVLVPFLPLPLAYVAARHGWIGGVVVAVVAGLLVYAGIGAGSALFVLLVVAGVGLPVGGALRKGWRFPRGLAVSAVSLLLTFVVFGLILWLVFGLGLTQVKDESYRSIADMGTLYGRMGLSAASIDALQSYARSVVDVFPYVAPGLLGMTVILLPSTTMGLAYLSFPRLRRPQAVGFSLSGFRMHWGVAYASIAGLAMLLFARGDAAWHSAVFYTGIDLLLVSQTLFFLQALGVLRWLGRARQWRTGARTFLFVVAVIAQAFIQLTGLVGLLDTWIDYRKRFALRGSGPGPLR